MVKVFFTAYFGIMMAGHFVFCWSRSCKGAVKEPSYYGGLKKLFFNKTLLERATPL